MHLDTGAEQRLAEEPVASGIGVCWVEGERGLERTGVRHGVLENERRWAGGF
jgi:hypothetical protein